VTLSPREAMILSFAIEPGTLTTLDDQVIARLAGQFGTSRDAVRAMTSRLDNTIRARRRDMDACQHEGKYAT
jgi:hypothetical protein